MKTIIGLVGKAKSGKDTTATFLKEAFEAEGHSVRLVAFADKLKQEVADALQIPVSVFMEQSERKEALRPLLQCWGDARKLVNGQDYWLRCTDVNPETKEDIVIITDIRYDFEAMWVLDFQNNYIQNVLISVERMDNVTTEHSNHSSEQGVSIPADIVIQNDPAKGLDALRKCVDAITVSILRGSEELMLCQT